MVLSCTVPKKNLRERYVRDNPGLKSEIKRAILDADVIPGMTKEHVYASRATPIFKGQKKHNGEFLEFWTYPEMKGSPYVNVYFSDNIVVEIEKIDKEPSIK